MSSPAEAPRPKAVLVGVQLPGVTDAEQRSSLMELTRLCKTLGFEVVGEVTQKRSLGAATLVGEGKLVELAAWTGGTGVVSRGPPGKKKATEEDEEQDESEPLHLDAPPAPTGEPRATVVVIDHELSPRQLHHIERATSAAAVLDRTGVIIEIFHRHASSRPARLQVEIARLTYVAPRLRETGGGERQRGGIGLKGAGESPWSSIAARFATASPSSRRSWPPSKTSPRRDGRGVRKRRASRWSGTPTRASRR